MRTTFIYFTLFCCFLLAKSQNPSFEFTNLANNFTFNTSQTFYNSTLKSNRHTSSISIKNISNTVQTYTIKRTDAFRNMVGPGDFAYAQYCIGPNCYDSTAKVTSFTMSPNSALVILFELEEASQTGISHIKYQIFNAFKTTESVLFSFKYNDVLSVNENSSFGLSHSNVSPNPSSANPSIDIQSLFRGSIELKIINALGAVVVSRTENLQEGKNKIEINTENLPSGIYYLNASQSSRSFTEKFVLLR